MIVYWIKRKNMTDPYKEGYVGVTDLSIQERFDQHAKNVYKKSIVKKAIEKYDDIEIMLLHEADKNECLKLEEEYRPDELIGWNIAKGGGYPPRMNEKTAKKISQTLKNKGMNPYSKNTHSKEANEKRRLALTGRKWFHDPVTMKNKLLHEKPIGWLPGRVNN